MKPTTFSTHNIQKLYFLMILFQRNRLKIQFMTEREKNQLTKINLFTQFPNKIRDDPVILTKIRQHVLPFFISLEIK